ncbi:hypothetical protein L1D19_21990 [Vibrio natriegens]|uniref:hypothetical protein n=1 Tax=Vibrio natriegens TaxID=691 RepID=UPI001EFCC58E|nr:hypothetical protein [Vibrio natriegens]MCG9702741.1 hypothetical protein [Vibrio natriegens]
MSYDIVYEQLALQVPEDHAIEQMRTFLIQRLGIEATTMSHTQMNQRLYEHYHCLLHGELYMLHVLIGSSNLFDSETNKRARRWQYCGTDTQHQLLLHYGCHWSGDAESGALKLYGRETKAEGWIKALRHALSQAKDYQSMPCCYRLEVWIRKPEVTNHHLSREFDTLKAHLEVFDATWREQTRSDEFGYQVSMSPQSAFEMWLFQKLVTRYMGRCWINGSEPSSHLVKKSSI